MKKIFNWYREGWRILNPIGKWILLIVFVLIDIAMVYPKHGLFWSIAGFIVAVTLIIWNGHMEYSIQKRQRDFLEKKHADDPDWETYKKLKSKFKGV